MSSVERRRAVRSRVALLRTPRSALRNGLSVRMAAVFGSACLVLSSGLVLGLFGGSEAGSATTTGPLAVAIASYNGDAVTSTPSESALAGTDVTEQVTVSNTTSGGQTNLSVPIDLPASFTLHSGSVTPSTGTTMLATSVITWTIPALAAGASATLSYTETTDAPAAFESDTTSASATSDQSTTADPVSATLEVIPAADLTIGVTDGTDTVAPGASDTYTITLTNNGPSPATNATVSETLSGGFAAMSTIASIGGTTFTDLGGGQFQWTGVNLPSGASAMFILIGTVPSPLPAGSAFVSLATVALPPDQVDTDAVTNAIDSDAVTGATTTGPLAVAIASYNGDAMTSTPSESALAGTDVTEQVTVSNTTSGGQTNLSVPIDLPASFTLHSGSVTPSTGTTMLATSVITWTIPALAAGASATLSYTETTDAPAAFESDTTSASATSDQSTTADPVSATLEVIPAADLTIGVTDGTDTVAPGASDTYTITLTNNGPSPATNATVSETLSGGFAALFSVSSIGGTTFTDLGGGQFQWTGVNLPSGASASFSIMGAVSSGLTSGGAFVSLATVALPVDQVGTGTSASAVDSDAVVLVPQTIIFAPPALGIAGQSATLSATGGASGNPVVFSVDPSSGAGVCSVSGVDGAALSYSQAGTCVVDVNQAGNASYAAAPTVTATITVDQSPAFTLDTPPTVGTVGQEYAYTFAASGVPTSTYSLSGAPSWLTLDAASGALTGVPPAGTASFTYSVVASNSAGTATAGPFAVAVSPGTTSRDADLSAALSCPETVNDQAVASCTLTVANAGPATARFVAAGISLPNRFHRLSSTPGGLWFGHTGVWFLRSLPPGASASYTVSFRAERPGVGWVWAAGLSRSPDPDQANNEATATVTVTG